MMEDYLMGFDSGFFGFSEVQVPGLGFFLVPLGPTFCSQLRC